MTPRTPSDEIYAMRRGLDATTLHLFGHTFNGSDKLEVNVTPDSWCGRITATVDKTYALAQGLEKRFIWGAATVVGAGAVINIAFGIWEHFAR